jgi:predicted DNA-binding protein (UPF0251 family)
MVYLEEVRLAVEECEAIRLADLEGMYQEEAAKKLKVSRQTFGRILENAHRKIAQAIVKGKALKIEGGDYFMVRHSKVRCVGNYFYSISDLVNSPL